MRLKNYEPGIETRILIARCRPKIPTLPIRSEFDNAVKFDKRSIIIFNHPYVVKRLPLRLTIELPTSQLAPRQHGR